MVTFDEVDAGTVAVVGGVDGCIVERWNDIGVDGVVLGLGNIDADISFAS